MKSDKKIPNFLIHTLLVKYKRIIAATLLFGLLAFMAYLPVYPLDPNQLPNCGCGDIVQSTWFLAWGKFAILHGINPYSSNWINYPLGVNLATNASYSLYSILLSPITSLLNVIAVYNLLLWLAFVLSALAMYYVMSKMFHRFTPAFLAGLFYGFSPYMIAEGYVHLNLIFIPFPPLIFYCVYKLFCTNSTNKYKIAIYLSIFIVLQYMMSSEVLATTFMMTLVGLTILGITHHKQAVYQVKVNIRPVLLTVLIVGLALWYPIYYSLDGPDHIITTAHPWLNQWNADLLGMFVPTKAQLLYPVSWKNLGTSFLNGAWYENGSYLGFPLLLGMALGFYALRKNKWVQFFGVMAFFSWVLSLGPMLKVNNVYIHEKLPFNLLQHVFLLNNILPSRLAMYTDLFIAILIGFMINYLLEVYETIKSNKNDLLLSRDSLNPRLKLVFSLLLVVIAALSLLPNWPYANLAPPAYPENYSAFFTTKLVDKIPNGAITLAYPYPYLYQTEAMMWQILSGMRFRLLGGDAIFSIPPGYPSGNPALLSPQDVEKALWYYAGWDPPSLYLLPPKSSLRSLRSFTKKNHVQVILVNTKVENAGWIIRYIKNDFGYPLEHADGIDLWVISNRSGGVKS